MIPKVIKTAAEHEAALAYVEKLMGAEPGTAAEARLELWAILIEKFEEEHFPIERPDPVSAIQFRMEQMGITQTDLSQMMRSKSKASEILGRRRPLSLNMIRTFHSGLGIPTDVLIQPFPIRTAATKTRKQRSRVRSAA